MKIYMKNMSFCRDIEVFLSSTDNFIDFSSLSSSIDWSPFCRLLHGLLQKTWYYQEPEGRLGWRKRDEKDIAYHLKAFLPSFLGVEVTSFLEGTVEVESDDPFPFRASWRFSPSEACVFTGCLPDDASLFPSVHLLGTPLHAVHADISALLDPRKNEWYAAPKSWLPLCSSLRCAPLRENFMERTPQFSTLLSVCDGVVGGRMFLRDGVFKIFNERNKHIGEAALLSPLQSACAVWSLLLRNGEINKSSWIFYDLCQAGLYGYDVLYFREILRQTAAWMDLAGRIFFHYPIHAED